MKTWIHHYRLSSPRFNNEGALFKFEFSEDLVGYADLHPWPELGDIDLPQQLKMVLQGEFTPQFKKTLFHAQVDAKARQQHINLFSDLAIPQSHYLISDLENSDFTKIRSSGYKRLKIKVDLSKSAETTKLINQAKDFKIRLDFNSKYKAAEVFNFLELLKKHCGSLVFIDFIEDPCKFEETQWKKMKETFGVRLAADREPRNKIADILIFKPALQLKEEIVSFASQYNQKIVVTTNLDHALGVAAAAWEAGMLYKEHPELLEDCGLLSHSEFEQDEFFSQIKQQGSTFLGIDGTGFGFDPILRSLKWEFFL